MDQALSGFFRPAASSVDIHRTGLKRQAAEYLTQPYNGRGHHFIPQNREFLVCAVHK